MTFPKRLRRLTTATIKTLHALPHLLSGTPIRTLYHAPTNTHYVSAVDICHLLCNPLGTVQTPQSRRRAKNYWHSIKRRDPRFDLSLGAVTVQLSLPDCHGRLRLTDVIDLDTVHYLIKQIAHKHSRVFKLWLLFVGARVLLRAVVGWVMQWVAQVVRWVRARGCDLRLAVTYLAVEYAVGPDAPRMDT